MKRGDTNTTDSKVNDSKHSLILIKVKITALPQQENPKIKLERKQILLYKALAVPIILHASETRVLTKRDEMKCFKKCQRMHLFK